MFSRRSNTSGSAASHRLLLLIVGMVIGGIGAFWFLNRKSENGPADRSDIPRTESQSGAQSAADVELDFAQQIERAKPSQSGPGESLSSKPRPEVAGRIEVFAGRIEVLNAAISDSDLQLLSSEMTWIDTLILDQGLVTDAGLDSIVSLPNLIHLRLRFSGITDTGFEKIAKCRSLRILNLPHSRCTAQGIESLQSLSKLRQLRLGSAEIKVTDQKENSAAADVAQAVSKLKSLRSVHLIGMPIDDEGLKQIMTLPELQSLYLDDSSVTEGGWDWLFENHPDLHVHVNQQHHDRDPAVDASNHSNHNG